MESFERGRHLVQVRMWAMVVVLLAMQGAEAQPEDWKIDSVVGRSSEEPWHVTMGRWFGKWGLREGKECEEQYGIMPCSTSLGGNAALLVAYGYMLLNAAQLLSEGSELLLEVTDPGIIGGLVLPILTAFPDALLITVSGLGASQAEAQEEVLVGMGLLSGSSVMVLTALWGSCLIAGRCDLVEHPRTHLVVAKDKTLTKGFHLTETGVTTDGRTMRASRIMIISLLPLLVAQLPRFFGLNTEEHAFIAFAAVIAVLGLIGYCVYQITAPWIRDRRVEFARQRYRRSHAFMQASYFARKLGWGSLFYANGDPIHEVWMKMFNYFDEEPKDGHLTQAELKALILGLELKHHNGEIPDDEEVKHWMKEFDVSNDGKVSSEEFLKGIKKWMLSHSSQKKKVPSMGSVLSHSGHWDAEAQAARAELALCDEGDDDDGEEENDAALTTNQTIAKAVLYLLVGVAVAAIFANPLVGAIGGFSKASGISPFFISFIAAPPATNSSEAVSAFIFARRKRKKSISMTYSQIYGGVVINNTMCLGVFLAIVFFRNLLWDFSAEVSVIFFATAIMGALTARRTTFPLWMAFIGLALYPLSIALVAFLEYGCGWH